MTSPDGITWTTRASAADNSWNAIAWAPELGLFCSVASTGTGTRIMTSPDGITWTTRTSAGDTTWSAVVWAPESGLFVKGSSTFGTGYVGISSDGLSWTTQPFPTNQVSGLAWSPELSSFCASSQGGTGRAVSSNW
jgi:hypothetical protein